MWTSLDHSLFTLINFRLSHPFFDWLFPAITDLHKNPFFLIPFVGFIYFLFYKNYRHHKHHLLFLGLLLSIATSDAVGNYAFKKQFERPRPGDDPAVHAIVRSPYGGYSFVSNHATNMFCLAAYSSVFFPAGRIAFFAVAAIVGYSRIYNGVHFPSDVIAGALLGTMIGFFLAKGAQRLLKRYS